MKKLSLSLFSILFLLLITNQSISFEKTITGKAQVIDGDTIKINGKRIRLFGIDAPELKQSCKNYFSKHCGKESKRYLEMIIGDSQITCFYNDKDKYGRILGVCQYLGMKINDPFYDINGWMVRFGQAYAYIRYSKRYLKAEIEAKKSRLGLWCCGKKQTPEEWRKKNK